MGMDQFQIIAAIGCYLLFSLVIGFWYAKKSNKNSEEYFLGGRGLGPWVGAMSAEASDMSGWLLMGLPGVAYFTGAGEAVWTAIGLALGTYVNWRFVAVPLRRYSEIAGNAITLPDFFGNRFRDEKKILMSLSSLVILVFFSIYVGSQFVTFGKFFVYVFGAQHYYKAMIILGALFVLGYTLLGGFLAESVTDFYQGILMIFALVAVLASAVFYMGGLAPLKAYLDSIPRFTDLFGIATPVDARGFVVTGALGNTQAVVNGQGLFGAGADCSFLSILSSLAWGLGYFGMPQVLLRFMAIRKSSHMRRARIIAVTWCIISLFAAVAIGIFGRAIFPGLLTTASDAETIFIHMSVRFFPPLLAGIVLSGILAASMSSSDSYMLIAASAVARNLMSGLLMKNISDRAVMWIARISLILVTLFGVIIALSGDDSIFRIVSYAWAGLGAAFGPLVLFSLFWRRTNLPGAIAGMLSGGIAVVLWKQYVSRLGGYLAVYELLPAFIISGIFIVTVSLLTPQPSKDIISEFDAVKTSSII